MATIEETAAVGLAQAAVLLEEGWCQGQRWQTIKPRTSSFVPNSMEVVARCLTGALHEALLVHMPAPSVVCDQAYYLAMACVQRELQTRELERWNDEAGRTKEEVIAVVQNAKRWIPVPE